MTRNLLRTIKLSLLNCFLVTFLVNCTASRQGENSTVAPTTVTTSTDENKVSTNASPVANQSAQNLTEGPGSGNGGKGILIDGKPYLLDLVEAGLEKDPYFNFEIPIDPAVRARVAKVLADPSYPVDLIAQKISEVNSRQYSVGLLMLKTLELFSWRFVNLPPAMVNDQRDGVEVQQGQYLQMAKRLQTRIIIDRKVWSQLDEKNKAALIFHEINYAFAVPIEISPKRFVQDTGAVQEFTAYLFSKDLFEKDIYYRSIRIFPKNFIFDNHDLMKELPSGVEISTTVKLGFENKNSKRAEDQWNILWQTPALMLYSDTSSDKGSYFKTNESSEVCKRLPSTNDQQIDLFYFFSRESIRLSIDMYLGKSDQFYSYVRVDSVDWIGFPNIIRDTKKNCVQKLQEFFDKKTIEHFKSYRPKNGEKDAFDWYKAQKL